MHKREYNKELPATEEIVWKTVGRLGDNAREPMHKSKYTRGNTARVTIIE